MLFGLVDGASIGYTFLTRGCDPQLCLSPQPALAGFFLPELQSGHERKRESSITKVVTMARLILEFPKDQFCFTTQMTVRITEINAGNHLGNDSLISMISEARGRFLFRHGIAEIGEGGTGCIVTDIATVYRAEAHARDVLLFEIGVMDFNKYGGDIIFRITRPADDRLIAMAKSGFVFYNYLESRVVPMPSEFEAQFPKVNRVA